MIHSRDASLPDLAKVSVGGITISGGMFVGLLLSETKIKSQDEQSLKEEQQMIGKPIVIKLKGKNITLYRTNWLKEK